MRLLQYCFADSPTPWQCGFQDPATASMESIIDLHHDLMFFLIAIFTLVVWLGARVCYYYHYTKVEIAHKFTHHANLELIWALLPSFIILLIAFPSLTLIYSFDHITENPACTVRVIGRQWYWQYELKENVTTDFTQISRLLELS